MSAIAFRPSQPSSVALIHILKEESIVHYRLMLDPSTTWIPGSLRLHNKCMLNLDSVDHLPISDSDCRTEKVPFEGNRQINWWKTKIQFTSLHEKLLAFPPATNDMLHLTCQVSNLEESNAKSGCLSAHWTQLKLWYYHTDIQFLPIECLWHSWCIGFVLPVHRRINVIVHEEIVWWVRHSFILLKYRRAVIGQTGLLEHTYVLKYAMTMLSHTHLPTFYSNLNQSLTVTHTHTEEQS